MKWMNWFIVVIKECNEALCTFPNLTMDSAGACLTVDKFTNSIILPMCWSWKEIFNMLLKDLDLCSIMVTGEILRFLDLP